ncbi:MAG: TonB-dependent receptor [Lentimonas sp.]
MESDHTHYKTAWVYALAAVSTAAPLAANTTDITEGEIMMAGGLPPYVVVTTRTPLTYERVSPSVDAVSGQELDFWQSRSLVDVLEQIPGLVLIESGAIGSQTSLFTRGTESNHTAFFLDGRRVNPGFGNQYNLEYLNLGNVESVQIQRGASSVHYGSSGIGGVVDMRTRSALDSEQLSGSVSSEVGSNDYRRGNLAARIGDENFGFSLAGSFLSTDNERANDEFESEFVNGRFDYRLTDELSIELIAHYSDSEKGLPNSVLSPKLEDVQDTEIWMVSPGVRFATDDVSVHVFYSRTESEADLDQVNEAFISSFPFSSLGFFPVSNTIEVVSDEVNLQVDYSITDDALFTFGAVYREDDASNTNLNTFSPLDPPVPYAQDFEQTGAFAQLLWLLGDFELRAGVRYDDYSEFDDQLTGNVELIYSFDAADATVFAKAATSYAPPGAADLAFDSNTDTALEPEESTSFEFGWRQTLLEGKLSYSVVLFHNDIDELIDFVYDADTFSFDSVNLEKATTEGVEFQVNYTGIEDLELALGYTYLTAVADYQDNPRTEFVFGFPDAAKDVRLARRARHMLQLSAIYSFTEDLRAGVQGVGHFDREDIDPNTFTLVNAEDYFVVRLVADWQINDAWSVFARVESLLDEDYSPAAGFPALGRAGYVGACWSF